MLIYTHILYIYIDMFIVLCDGVAAGVQDCRESAMICHPF